MWRSICPPRSTARITGIMRTKRRSIYKRRCCTPPTFDAARSDARFGRSAEAGSTNPQLSSPRASAGMCGGIRAHVEMELVRKPESSRMRRKSVSKRKLIFQVPMVRIHFPPAASPLRTRLPRARMILNALVSKATALRDRLLAP
jgi:hypothetical protein